MNAALTAHQVATLRTILRNGGHSQLTNGRTSPGWLRTTTVTGLMRRGLVVCVWTAKHTVTKPGEATHDYFYFVSARGCIAMHEVEMAEAEAAEAVSA